ncbi:MAG TPA: twin-arginine translocase TatA/TatE family subunit [Longimicrobiales bacterium]
MVEGFGPEKLIFILLILILVFGAKRLPEIGQSLGKGIREFKKSVKGDFDEGQAPQQPQYQAPQQPQMFQAQYPPQQLQAGVPGAPVAQAAPAQQQVAPGATAPTQQYPTQA